MAHRLLERLAPERKKAAHWISDRNLHYRTPNTSGEIAQPRAVTVPGANAPLLDIATADHRIDHRLALQRIKHAWQQPLVMLEVGVHYRDVRRGARQDAFDAGGSKPAAADPLNATHPAVLTSKPVDHLRHTILRLMTLQRSA